MPHEEHQPLSLSQQRLWFMDSLRSGTALLNLPAAFSIRGPLDTSALRAALRQVIRRHESLRSAISRGEDGPSRVVESHVRFELEEMDGTRDPEHWAPERIAEALLPLVSRPLPSAEPPLLRAGVVRLRREHHVLWLVASRLVWDRASIGVLVEELRILYPALARRKKPERLPAPRQYGAYLALLDGAENHRERQAHLEYWKETLGGSLPTLGLPLDKPRPAHMRYNGAAVPFEVSQRAADRLRALGRASGATMEAVLLAVLDVLLLRYTGERDIAVGLSVDGRATPEAKGVIGPLASTRVLRVDVDPKASFRDLLAKVRSRCEQAEAHPLPFEEVVEALRPPRDRSRTPLFQVSLCCEEAKRQRRWLGRARLEELDVHAGSSSTDLAFLVKDDGKTLRGVLEYATDLFEPETARRILSCLTELVDEVGADPGHLVGELDGCRAHRAQIAAWNATFAPYREGAVIQELLEEQVRKTPDAVAIHFEGEDISYGQLWERAGRLARRLVATDVGPDALVGLCMQRSISLVVAMIAILRAGGAYVPLDPGYPAERLKYMLEDSGARILVCESSTLGLLSVPGVTPVIVDQELLSSGPSSFASPGGCSSASLAYAIYTSGSTGKPKGVLVEHRNVVSFLRGMEERVDLSPGGVWLAGTSISFDISVLEIFGALTHGLSVALLGEKRLGDAAHDGYGIADLIERYGVTHFQCTPSQVSILLSDPRSRSALSRLRQLLVGGEALSRELAEQLLSIRVAVIDMYGPTETTVWSSTHRVTDAHGSIPIGRPIANTRFYVLDGAHRPCPIGAPGALFISGAGVVRGYHRRPELTAERFRPDPFSQGFRMYDSGDVVRYRPDGALEYLGRNDRQVKVRGHRVELAEIEGALLAQPGISEAVVVERKGDPGGPRLVAYVVMRDAALSQRALRAELKSTLPPHMIPGAIVELARLPLTPNGKVDRNALPPPDAGTPPVEQPAALSATERELVRIWQAALGVAEIGVNDDFFDLGGHSLLGVRLLSEVYRVFGVRLSLAALFESPSVSTMAARISDARRGNGEHHAHGTIDAWSTIVPIHPQGSLPPFFCVAGKGGNPMNLRHVAAHLGPEQPFFGLQHRGVDGKLEPHDSVAAMAAEFLADIRRIQPVGPYYIGGFSGGGTAAFEMAQMLRASGESVGALVLLEGENPRLPKWRAAEKVRYHIGRLANSGPSYLVEAVRHGVERRTSRLRDLALSKAARVKRFEYRNEAVTVAWQKMEDAYVPSPYPGSAYLLRARERDTLVFDAYNGWRTVILGEIFVHEVPGGHVTFVDPENAASTARELADVLRHARERFAVTRAAPVRSRVKGGLTCPTPLP